ncbi:YhdT family protein [Pseudalkalibacillus sp. A8]|uniref:YhdT family protein n=1 Tax=Pseudalkalibacillus sp. A8 TaxID=3382641 RepID=UPI0038B5386E
MENFKEDRRFRQCTKEMWMTILFFIFNLLVTGGISLWIGYNKPVSEVDIVMGFPDWFFYGGIVGWFLLMIGAYFMVKLFFKDMSLEAEEGGEKK